MNKPVVLHVVEALGGGVMVAVKDYITSTKEDVVNVVLANRRPGHDTGDLRDVPILDLGKDKLGPRVSRRVAKVIRDTKPDLLHLHSSWAGLIGRLQNFPSSRIVYTPHCYAFERLDVSTLHRKAFRSVESSLAARTGVVAAVSPREAALARSLGPGAVAYVPNIAGIDAELSTKPSTGPFSVVGCGRVMMQKGPTWFAQMANEVRSAAPESRVRWLGGGDSGFEKILRDSGVSVSGWLPRSSLLREMQDASVYVHSAAWEGAPLSVIEALSFGVPIVSRNTKALESMGLVELYTDPSRAAERVLSLRDNEFHGLLRKQSLMLAKNHTEAEQRRALLDAYGRLLSPSAEAKTARSRR